MRSKVAIKNIISAMIGQIITLICGFVIPRLIIENFGSSVNGLTSSIAQFLGYISLLESGIGPVIMSALYKPLAKKDNREIANIIKSSQKFFRTIAYVFLIYLVVLCIIYPTVINNEFDKLFTISLILIIAISTFAEYFLGMTYKLFLNADQKGYIVSSIQIITTILNAIFVVVLVKIGCSIQIVKLASVSIFALRPILQYIYIKKKYNINLKEADSNYKLKQKLDGLAQHIASVVHSNTDVAVLTIFSNLKEVSVYSIYLLVVNGIKNLTLSLRNGIDALFGDIIAKEEKELLNKGFRIYELFYFTIITIIFTCTLVLIVPFVSVYTRGISDINYARPLFGFLIVLAEFVDCIRLPYGTLISSAGKFKETRIGAWVEALLNLGVSIALVTKYGIVGVAIGTLLAMTIRTTEFIMFTSKNILERNITESIKRIIIIILQVAFIYIIKFTILDKFIVGTYLEWFLLAIATLLITIVVVGLSNSIIYKDDLKEALKIILKTKNKEE